MLEFEKYYSALGVGTTKNRNAGLVSWEDGVWLDKPKFTMTGFTAKRVSETKLAKEVQTETLKWWVQGLSLEDITKKLHTYYSSVLNGDYPLINLIKRSRLRTNRTMVKCVCKKEYHLKEVMSLPHGCCKKCGVQTRHFTTLEGKKPTIGSGIAGIVYAWQKEDKEFDDSYLFLKIDKLNDSYINPLTRDVRKVEYVAGTTYADFDTYSPDWKHYAAEQVVKKAEPIFKAMDWDISAIRTGRIQKTLEEWF